VSFRPAGHRIGAARVGGDVEAIDTYGGTETIQTLLVGRDITGVGAFA
jgi:glutaryl-CoA dehydrogenase